MGRSVSIPVLGTRDAALIGREAGTVVSRVQGRASGLERDGTPAQADVAAVVKTTL